VEVKTAPVIDKSVEVIVAKAARSTEISATTILTEGDEAARPVAVVDATTDATITGAGAVTVIARTLAMTSDAMAATRALARDAVVVVANTTATTMGAHGSRKRAIMCAAGLRSEGAVLLRARMCVAATS
jgi:hypothetical protein